MLKTVTQIQVKNDVCPNEACDSLITRGAKSLIYNSTAMVLHTLLYAEQLARLYRSTHQAVFIPYQGLTHTWSCAPAECQPPTCLPCV